MDSDVFDEVLATIHDFVRSEVVPAEDEIEETDEIPERIRRQAAAMGLFGYAIPEEYGGLGVTMSEEVRIALEFGWTTPTFRSMVATNNGIAGQVLVNYGTEAQKQEFLPRMAAGEIVACFALTEPEAGSDPSGMTTRAERTADGTAYLISGQKRFITNAPEADLIMTFARTGETISVFAVDANSAGLTVGPADRKMGQRGAHTAEVFFDQVRVPAERLIGEAEGEGFTAAMKSLAKGRLHIAALATGMAERLLAESITAARDTKQGGASISRFQLVQAMLAESKTETYAARSLVIAAAKAYDDGTDRRIGPSCAKLFCTETADKVADRAVQIHGGMGYMHGTTVERFYRDARLFRLYEGTSEIQKVIIAKQLLKGAN